MAKLLLWLAAAYSATVGLATVGDLAWNLAAHGAVILPATPAETLGSLNGMAIVLWLACVVVTSLRAMAINSGKAGRS